MKEAIPTPRCLKSFFPSFFLPSPYSTLFCLFFIVNVFAEDLEYLWMIMFHWLPYRLENWKAIPPDTAKFLQSLFTEARRVMSGRLFDRDARRGPTRKLYQVTLSRLNIPRIFKWEVTRCYLLIRVLNKKRLTLDRAWLATPTLLTSNGFVVEIIQNTYAIFIELDSLK